MDQVGNVVPQVDNAAVTRSPKENKPRKPAERSQRLAVELRENLHRRKAQERGRATSDASKPPQKPAGSKNDEVP
jgi:hypothetical protein